MLSSFPIAILVGAVLGYLAGLGVGGGSLLILWLTLILHTPSQEARLINLMFFITGAGTVSLFRWKQGTLHFRKILPAILWGAAAAGVTAWFSSRMDTELLRKLFGILLLFTGTKELFYRSRKAK